jgi:hypothetical protein
MGVSRFGGCRPNVFSLTPREFCPQCGQARTGNFRFCRNCAFDFRGGTAPPIADPQSAATRNRQAPDSDASGPPIAAIFALLVGATGIAAFVWIVLLNGGSTGTGATPAVSGTATASTSTAATITPALATATLTPEIPAETPASTVTLSGQGDKTGPALMLEGNYTLTAKVTANAGCSWTLTVQPGNNKVVDISTDAAGSQGTSLPISLAVGSYQLVVASTNCGDWTVSLAR